MASSARLTIREHLDVHVYLDDMLRRALAGETDWASLAPHAWATEHPESIRTYRQDNKQSNVNESEELADEDSTLKAKWCWCTVTSRRLCLNLGGIICFSSA